MQHLVDGGQIAVRSRSRANRGAAPSARGGPARVPATPPTRRRTPSRGRRPRRGFAPERVQPLERMAERVTVVEDEPGARVPLVRARRCGPWRRRSGRSRPPGRRCRAARPGRDPVSSIARSSGSSVSAYFATSASPDRSRGRRASRGIDVGEDRDRLGERPDEVLALREVHRRLAPDRGVDLCGQRRRHLEEGHAPHVRGGDEPARSPTAPPPSASTASSRCASRPASCRRRLSYAWSDFASSPSGTSNSTEARPRSSIARATVA